MAGTSSDLKGQQSDPTQLWRDLFSQIKDQGDKIDTTKLRDQQTQITRACDQIVTDSGATAEELETAGTHRDLMGSKLPEWAQKSLSKVQHLVEQPRQYGTDKDRVGQAITRQMQTFSTIMTGVGLTMPAEATSGAYAGTEETGRQRR
ncbi:MAG: hypothetical protein K0S68_485 [Candidatus Saccharibacteria bacterium]|jgi:hypothetical protein|nr:hypothetical protein [Candidatus Saccharibacteria bacterium]